MDLSRKIRIRAKASDKFRIDVKEKISFFCKHCQNRYNDPQYFCPQCLGEVLSSSPRSCQLKIANVPEDRREEVGQLLAILSGKKEFPFRKLMQSFPWVAFKNSDPCVLLHWKEVLEAEKAVVEIEPASEPARKLSFSKGKAALFESDTPLPFLFYPETDALIRSTARAIQTIALRIKWVQVCMQALRIMEGFYKRNPSTRILFADYVFQIDHELHESSKTFETYYKTREEEFEKLLDRLAGRLDSMEEDINAVKQQVDERL